MHERKLKAGADGTGKSMDYLNLKENERPSIQNEVERMNGLFKLGNPTINEYRRPDEGRHSFETAFLANMDKLRKHLLDKAREELDTFVGASSFGKYPYISGCDKAIVIQLHDDCGCVTFDADSSGGVIMYTHNLDWSSSYRIVAFNLASELVELIFPDVKAPRIYKESIVYWLPKGFGVLPKDGIISNKEQLSKMHEFYGLGKLKSVKIEADSQKIEGEHGCITIEKGTCTATGFNQYIFPEVTCMVALLVDSCYFGVKRS